MAAGAFAPAFVLARQHDEKHMQAGDSLSVTEAPAAAKHRLATSQYLVLLGVMLGAAVGDALLGRGMRDVGPVSVDHLGLLLHALLNPWVFTGIVVLLGFMACYMTALSWADITFVLPATAFGNVITALLSRLWLHEHITATRWLGIALIVLGVGFVANGPARTDTSEGAVAVPDAAKGISA